MVQELFGAHVRELQCRWEAAMLAESWDAVLVHAGSPITSFLDDYVYDFRPNPHFLAWLPLTQHSDSVLLIRPGERPLLWFYQPEDYWYLPPADPEAWWAQHFEVRVVSKADTWEGEIPRGQRVAVLGDAPSLSAVFADGQALNPVGLLTRLHLERTRKTAYELACIRQASLQAARAHRAAEQAFRAGRSEFEIHLAYLDACRQTDAELPYHSIVALNEHGAVLHYQQRDRSPPGSRRSFLIDAGSTVHAYAADITRTYAAAAGEFADLIEAMDAVQQELAGKVQPGLSYPELHLLAHRRIADVLRGAGIIKVNAEDAVATGLSSVFFPHGLGHFIGLQTHDVAGLIGNTGANLPRPDGHPYLRLTRELEPGNVLTIEPGLYFIAPLLQRWRETADVAAIDWQAIARLSSCGGIRIEDNIAVTAQGSENLTRDAFARLA